MGVVEEGTLAALKAGRRELIDPEIAEHRGRIVKTTGDGALVEFASAVEAVRCALEIQRAMAGRNADVPDNRRIEFRIGINLGDVIIDEGDIYGEGVNIAARLEALASRAESAFRKMPPADRGSRARLQDMGEQQLKNITRPVRVLHVRRDGTPARPPLAPPDKPSIAVLPFQNMSGDPEQDYFCRRHRRGHHHGACRAFRAAVRHRPQFVLHLQGPAIDVKQVGPELGVRYVLEGSVRKAEPGSHHRAAHRRRRPERISGPTVRRHARGRLRPSGSGHRGRDRFDCAEAGAGRDPARGASRPPASTAMTTSCAERQVFIKEPRRPLARPSGCFIGPSSSILISHRLMAWLHGATWYARRTAGCRTSWKMARKLHGSLGELRSWAGMTWLRSVGAGSLLRTLPVMSMLSRFIDQALTLNPNLAAAWNYSGWVRIFIGEHVSAIERFERSLRLSPRDPTAFHVRTGIAYANLLTGHYDKASSLARDALRGQSWLGGLRILAASKALAGQLEEAQGPLTAFFSLIPRCAFPTSKIVFHLSDRKISLSMWTACEKPDCRSDQRANVCFLASASLSAT